MHYFNSIPFHKSGTANKLHTYKSTNHEYVKKLRKYLLLKELKVSRLTVGKIVNRRQETPKNTSILSKFNNLALGEIWQLHVLTAMAGGDVAFLLIPSVYENEAAMAFYFNSKSLMKTRQL